MSSLVSLFVPLAHAANLNPVGSVAPGQDSSSLASNLIGTLFTALFSILGFVAAIYVVWAGIQFISSTGDPEKAKKARAALVQAVIGIIIIAGAYGIINLVIRLTSSVPNVTSNLPTTNTVQGSSSSSSSGGTNICTQPSEPDCSAE